MRDTVISIANRIIKSGKFNISDKFDVPIKDVFYSISVVKKCLEINSSASSIEYGTTTSLEVYSTSESDYLVIEFGISEALSVIFTYGSPPVSLHEHAEACVLAQGFLVLTSEEQEYLEINGIYHQIF